MYRGLPETEPELLILLTALREGQPYADVEEGDLSENGRSKIKETSTKSEKQLELTDMKTKPETSCPRGSIFFLFVQAWCVLSVEGN